MLELFPRICTRTSKLLPIGDRVTFENAHQDSEYDFRSDEEEREAAEDQREDSLDLIAINFVFIRQSYFFVTSSSRRFYTCDFGRRFPDFMSTSTKPGHYSLWD